MAVSDRHFSCHVLGSSQLSQHLVRLVLGGPGLEGFASSGRHDEWIQVFPAPSGAVELLVPRRSGDAWVWTEGQPEGRYLTVRDFDLDTGSLTVDVVVHESGPITEWAQSTRLGDQAVVSSPRGSFTPPQDARWVWLVGDITALPAISRIVENLPVGLPTRALVEVPGPTDRLPLISQADLSVTWLEHAPKPGDVSVLAAAVREHDWPEGNGYLWMAGEAGEMRSLRRYLRHERGLANSSYDVMGYWRFDARRWSSAYEAANIDVVAIWEEGERQGRDPASIWDSYEQALFDAGL